MQETKNKNYLMVLQCPYYRLDTNKIAIESAFSEHLKLWKAKIMPEFTRLLVALPEMSLEDYQSKKSLAILHENEENIFFISLYQQGERKEVSKYRYIVTNFIPLFKHINRLVADCNLLHSGLSTDIWIPSSFMAVICGIFQKKNIVYYVDIDYRNSAWMLYKTGFYSRKNYFISKYIYYPFQSLQVAIAVSKCNLVALKGKKFCRDFGKGKHHVKYFLDAAHSADNIIGEETLNIKIAKVLDLNSPLELVYFGRLVAYKGVDRCLHALKVALSKTSKRINFHVIGSGEQEEFLIQLTEELNLQSQVYFYEAVPYGPSLFKMLHHYHLLLATPLSEDTPRSALDAMAAALPIVAYNTYYYEELVETGAVTVVDWLSSDQMAQKIVDLADDRKKLAAMMKNAVIFAQNNTQEIWLDRRHEWQHKY